MTRETSGKSTVNLHAVPSLPDTAWTDYTYYTDGKIQQKIHSSGAKTICEYDPDGNLSKEEQYTSSAEKNMIAYTYNHLRKLTQERVYVQERDIYGQPETSGLMALTSNYTYDPNGNLLTFTDAAGITTTYTYDQLNRQLSTSRPGTDGNGSPVTITTGTTYDWAGNPLTKINENGRVTTYTYDQRSFLSKITDAKNGVTYYAHDRAGRKLAEVLPNHYLPCTGLEEMNRTQFAYDKMDRLLRKTYNYIKPDSTWADIIVEAYRYDNNGNMVKKQDALGYNGGYGTEYSSTRATA